MEFAEQFKQAFSNVTVTCRCTICSTIFEIPITDVYKTIDMINRTRTLMRRCPKCDAIADVYKTIDMSKVLGPRLTIDTED